MLDDRYRIIKHILDRILYVLKWFRFNWRSAVNHQYWINSTWFLLSLGTITFGLIDPFGMSEASQSTNQTIYANFTAPLYRSTGQESITVVLITDAFIEHLHDSWPLSATSYVEMMLPLLDMNPRAVFVDIVFGQERGSPDEVRDLQQVIADAAHPPPDISAIPIILADLNENVTTGGRCPADSPEVEVDVPPTSKVLPAFACAATQLAPISWSDFGSYYPLRVDTAEKNGVFRETPALQLYRLHCRTSGIYCRGSDSQGELTASDFPPLWITWGAVPSKAMAEDWKTMADDCKIADEGLYNRARAGLELLWRQIFNRIGNGVIRCPYTDTVPAELLLSPPDLVHELVKPLIENRLVLVGIANSGSNDYIPSPLHGKLPGVYLHAMALDNLITQGDDYIRRPPEVFEEGDRGYRLLGWLSLGNVIEVMAIAFIAFIHDQLAKAADSISKNPPPRAGLRYRVWYRLLMSMLAGFIVLAVVVLATTLIAWFVASVMLYPPVNWFGILGVLIAINGSMGRRRTRPDGGSKNSPVNSDRTGSVP